MKCQTYKCSSTPVWLNMHPHSADKTGLYDARTKPTHWCGQCLTRYVENMKSVIAESRGERAAYEFNERVLDMLRAQYDGAAKYVKPADHSGGFTWRQGETTGGLWDSFEDALVQATSYCDPAYPVTMELIDAQTEKLVEGVKYGWDKWNRLVPQKHLDEINIADEPDWP